MSVIAEDDAVQIQRLTLSQYGTNTYILTCKQTKESAVVDAPGEVEKITSALSGTKPRYILITHAHMDHIGALAELVARLEVAVAINPLDGGRLSVKPELLLKDGDVVSFGEVRLKVLHTPGHTPGSICFLTGKFLIAGDTIFPGGPGRTSSPENLKQIIASIKGKIFTLPDDTRVFPGHGNDTILRKEKEAFAVFATKPHDPNLCGDVLWLSL